MIQTLSVARATTMHTVQRKVVKMFVCNKQHSRKLVVDITRFIT